jgi:hypothetical protein
LLKPVHGCENYDRSSEFYFFNSICQWLTDFSPEDAEDLALDEPVRVDRSTPIVVDTERFGARAVLPRSTDRSVNRYTYRVNTLSCRCEGRFE